MSKLKKLSSEDLDTISTDFGEILEIEVSKVISTKELEDLDLDITIDYDESTDSAELVVGNDNINISTDFSNILSGSGKTASDFMRDIALTLGDGEYAIKFEYEGPTTAVIEVARNINHLPNFLNREVNACVTITCSITLKTNFPFRFIEVLIDYLNRQFMAKVMAAVLIGVIYVLTPIDEALLVAAGTNTLATFFA